MSKIINVSHLFDDEPKTKDVVRFTVTWLEKGVVEYRDFDTFASAAGFAGAMHDRTKRIVILSADINQSHYGSMYTYKNGTRKKDNPGFIAQVKAALENN